MSDKPGRKNNEDFEPLKYLWLLYHTPRSVQRLAQCMITPHQRGGEEKKNCLWYQHFHCLLSSTALCTAYHYLPWCTRCMIFLSLILCELSLRCIVPLSSFLIGFELKIEVFLCWRSKGQKLKQLCLSLHSLKLQTSSFLGKFCEISCSSWLSQLFCMYHLFVELIHGANIRWTLARGQSLNSPHVPQKPFSSYSLSSINGILYALSSSILVYLPSLLQSPKLMSPLYKHKKHFTSSK